MMAQRSSRQSGLLRVRRAVERQRQNELAAAEQRLAHARALVLVRAPRPHVARPMLSAGHLHALHLQGVLDHELLTQAQDEFAASVESVDEAKSSVAGAHAERRSAELLEGSRRSAAAAVAARAAQSSLDELVSSRWSVAHRAEATR